MLSQPVVDLLKDLTTAGGNKLFVKVSGAADFTAAKEDLAKLKNKRAAYVIPLGDTAQPNTLLGDGIEQHVIELFGVVIAIENKRDLRGDAVNADLEAMRDAVIKGLLGVAPDTDYDPVNYGGGMLLALDKDITWWQIKFVTGYYERNW